MELRKSAYKANLSLMDSGLIKLTWGNVSVVDRNLGVLAIKPSGVPYSELTPEKIVVVTLDTNEPLDSTCRPSSDTATHAFLYNSFPAISSVIHTHSHHAVAYAQAEKDIPCLGTTHADFFFGPIPVTRMMTRQEIEQNYVLNIGRVIVECFNTRQIDPLKTPGVLVSRHGPFTWGESTTQAIENAIVLEEIAKLAHDTISLRPNIDELPHLLRNKHYFRKHGENAYYGQKSG